MGTSTDETLVRKVSLLWNAVLSRLLLRERFSIRTLAGTCLIATGASLIAIFGVVPEQNHTLEELMDLFRRKGFVVYITLMSVAVVGVLAVVSSPIQDYRVASCSSYSCEQSHLVEFGLHRKNRTGTIRLPEDLQDTPELSDNASIDHRRHSIPFQVAATPRRITESNDTPSPPGTPSTLITKSAMRQRPVEGALDKPPRPAKRVRYKDPSVTDDGAEDEPYFTPIDSRSKTLLGLSFAACSGTLSGMSLLFAKCAVELLILTFASKGKQNQFKSVQSWFLLVGLGITALAQLYYLNYSLRLAGPAMICPLAFCFYNISSIFGESTTALGRLIFS